ncbi:MAG: Uncharacterized protein LiPW30_577 [Parcubacteria group bacterium LiPW_30]|nr:MAG: Uncharacterized protein LiPW30_577 [Parcubacteria group bacterium LiPW_30]
MQEILEHIREKINRVRIVFHPLVKILQNKDIFTILTIILVAFASFGLGRLSKIEETKTPVTITGNGEIGEISNFNNITAGEKRFVASRNGKKYFLEWCSGAKTISPQNKITFSSEEEAKNAGYTPAANCPGLTP